MLHTYLLNSIHASICPATHSPSCTSIHHLSVCFSVSLFACLHVFYPSSHPFMHLLFIYSFISYSLIIAGRPGVAGVVAGRLFEISVTSCSYCFIVVKVSILHWHCMNTLSVCANTQSLVVMPIPGILVLSLLYDHFWDHYTYC